MASTAVGRQGMTYLRLIDVSFDGSQKSRQPIGPVLALKGSTSLRGNFLKGSANYSRSMRSPKLIARRLQLLPTFVAKQQPGKQAEETKEQKIARLLAENSALKQRLGELEGRVQSEEGAAQKEVAKAVKKEDTEAEVVKAPGPGVKKVENAEQALETDAKSPHSTGSVQTEEGAVQMAKAPEPEVKKVEDVKRTHETDVRSPHTKVQVVTGPSGIKRILPKLGDIVWPSPDDPTPFWKSLPVKKSSKGAASGASLPNAGPIGGNPEVELDPNPMHVVHVTAEMAPLAKVGGLGDVVTGLARACIARGHRVEVMLPFYECIDQDFIEGLIAGEYYDSFHKGGWMSVRVHRGLVSGIPVIFLEPQNNFFKGSRIYGGSYDELEAYLFFSRACLEYLQVKRLQPDIIHIHEWHTSGLAMLYWDMYHELGLHKPRLVLTIHNMEHHGECRAEQLDICGLHGQSYLVEEKAMDDRTKGHNPERASLLKGGIVYSNAVTTVSPTYSQETLCSGWLAATLMRYRSKYTGILNGIDTVIWDTLNDPYLPATYSATNLDGKGICKHYVQRGLGLDLDLLPNPEVEGGYEKHVRRQPLVACVTRLVAQKGVHLIRHAIFRTQELGGQFLLLGSSPDPRIQAEFQGLANEFKDSTNVRLVLTYSEALAHLVFAAADILLVPSMFEPCGLTQMIGMRYGTVPVVRRTGGLADTVFDVDDQANSERANGFVFDGIDNASLDSALDRAIRYFKERPEWWAELTSNDMKIDHSWNKSAGEYVSMYAGVRS